MERIICLAIGYVFGLFQTGYIYGRMNGIDIRNEGSGNAGTTNVLRTLGKKAGVITYIGDTIKAVLASLVIRLIFKDSQPDILMLLILYGGLGVVLGHNYPFYLGFKGGKGIAASSGVIISIGYWPLTIIGFFTFFGVAFASHYVSLGSLVLMAGFLIEFIVFSVKGMIPGIGPDILAECIVLVAIMTALAYWRHRANIVRLVHGNERKIGGKKENK